MLKSRLFVVSTSMPKRRNRARASTRGIRRKLAQVLVVVDVWNTTIRVSRMPDKVCAPWLAEYLHEMSVFPNGKHDAQVDSTAQFLD